jgi:hypothetical protein
MHCNGKDAQGQACTNTVTSGKYCTGHAAQRTKTRRTIREHAARIRLQVDTENQLATPPNAIVDAVTVEVYNRLFGN